MPCLVGCIALSAPRLAVFLVFLFSDYLGRAYSNNLVPFLGFLFMPLTTLAYAWAKNTYGTVEGIGLVLVVLAVLVDIGALGAGEHSRRSAANA